LSRPDQQLEHRSAHGSCAVRADAAPHPRGGSHPRAQGLGKLIGALGPKSRLQNRLAAALRSSPEREERVRVVASGRRHAVATIDGSRDRRPVADIAGHQRPVHVKLAAAAEVAAVASSHRVGGLATDGAGAQRPGLVVTAPGEDQRIAAGSGTGSRERRSPRRSRCDAVSRCSGFRHRRPRSRTNRGFPIRSTSDRHAA